MVQKRGVLFPFLIRANGAPAGFVFISRPPHVTKDADFAIVEFFILRVFRKKGIAKCAVSLILDRFHGRWEGFILLKNIPAQAFWRRVLHDRPNLKFETNPSDLDGHGSVKFRFTNSPPARRAAKKLA